ncbi:MAG: hypothetical protein M3135_08205 [Actinomycetota bacterium]|nr:hypothetical protein [Actinomycetota bacterium]
MEDRLTERIRRLQGRQSPFRDRLVEAETETNNAVSDAQLAVHAGRDLESDLKALRTEMARLRDESGSPLPELAGWFAAGLLGGVGITLHIARRRPGQPVPIPTDDVPPAAGDEDWQLHDERELVVSGLR